MTTRFRSDATEPVAAPRRAARAALTNPATLHPTGRRGRRAGPRFSLHPLVLALATVALVSPWPGGHGLAQAQAVPPGVPPVVPPVLPSGMTVVNGQAKAVVNGGQMTVTNTANTILNWQSFSIGSGNGVHFAQPGSASQVLNRVTGNDPSSILGSLTSNGRVWLLNPNGVLFGQGARVDVAGLVASTLSLSNADWLGGRYNLLADPHGPAAAVVNQGELRSSLGGHIALIGGDVRNEGAIDVQGGQLMLAAGRSVDLVDTGAPNLRLRVNAPAGEALNLGSLSAAGGAIDVHAAVVNQQGVVRADSLGTNAAGEITITASRSLELGAGSVTSASGGRGGRISLDSGAAGTTVVRGEVLATGQGGVGGQVTLLGQRVGLFDAASVDVSGASGGQVLVGGGESGRDATVRNAESVYVGQDARLRADGLGGEAPAGSGLLGHGGRIILWGDLATRAYGSFSARGAASGGDGGFIETSGGWIDVRPARMDATAAQGRAGTWLLDPYDLTITGPATTGGVGFAAPGTWTANASGAQIAASDIVGVLNSGNNVVVSTGTAGTENGDIRIDRATLTAAPLVPVSLTLLANRNIIVTGSRIASDRSPLSISLLAARGGFGNVQLSSSNIVTSGGDFTAIGSNYNADDFAAARGIVLSGTSISAGAGKVTLTGTSTATLFTTSTVGVSLSSSQVRGGTVDITGNATSLPNDGFAVGVSVGNFSSVEGLNGVSLRGTSSGRGVAVDAGSRVAVVGTAPTGGLLIDGTSTWNNFTVGASSAGFNNAGVDIDQYGGGLQTLQASGGGAITVTGTNNAGAGSLPSLRLTNGVSITTGTGGLVLRGNNSASIRAVAAVGGSIRVYGDDVTLVAGNALTSTATGDAIVVAGSSGANTTRFVNQAGAGSLNTPTAGGRWLVYGQNTGAVTGGGLVAAFKQYNARFGEANALTPTAGNGLLYTEAPSITVAASGINKVFDGNATANFPAGFAPSITGQRDGDVVQLAAGATGTYNDRNAGTNKPIGLAASALNVADVNGIPVLGYGVSSGLSGNITPAPVTQLVSGFANKTYDGGTAAQIVRTNYTGTVGGETLNFLDNHQFASSNAGNGIAVSGSSTLQNGTGLASNYTLVNPTINGTANIAPRQLTLGGLTAANKAYDGSTTATVGATLLGLVGTQTLASTFTGSFDTKDAGTGKTVTVSTTLANGTNGGLASNYVAPTPATTTANITPKTLTVSSITAANKVYDGNTVASIGLGALQGLVGTETLGSSGTGSFDTKDAGTGKTVTLGGVVLSNGTGLASNYQVATGTVTTTANITPKALTLSGVVAADKVYDGNAVASLSGGTLGGLVGSETLSTSLSGRFDTKDVGTGKTVSVNVLTGNGGNGGLASNYTVAPTTTTSASITPAPLTVTANDATKTFGSTLAFAGTEFSASGLRGGESIGNVSLSSAGAAATASVAGGPYAIVASNATGGSFDPRNYNIRYVNGSLTVTPLALNAVVANIVGNPTKTYDGSTTATLRASDFSLFGFVNGDGAVVTQTVGRYDSANAGNRVVTASLAPGQFTPVGSTDLRNYTLPTTASGAGTILQRDLNVVGTTVNNKVYDGNTAATVASAGRLNGLVAGETLGFSLGNANFQTKDAGVNKTVTIEVVSLSNGSGLASNYRVASPTTASADITPKTLTLAGVSAANKVYDGNTVASVSVGGLQGLVGTEQLTVNASGNFDTKDAGTGKTVTVSTTLANGTNGGLAGNYTLAPSATTRADITPKTLTLAGVSAANKVYDGNTVASVTAGALQGLVGSEQLTVNASGNFDTKDAGTGKTVTVSTTLANGTNGGLAGNYTLAPSATTRADITPKPLSLGSLGIADKVYDGNTVATVTLGPLQGLVGNETLNATATGRFDTKDVGTNKLVTVDVSFANGSNGGLASNYVLPTTPVTRTGGPGGSDGGASALATSVAPLAGGTVLSTASITPATLTVTALPAIKLVGAPVPALSGRVDGFVAGETLATATNGQLRFTTPATVTSPAGQYAITGGDGLVAPNYRIVQAGGNNTALTITGVAASDRNEGSTSANQQSLAAVTLRPSFSGPGDGRVHDVIATLRGDFLGQGALFASVPVATLSTDALTTLLSARDAYKKSLFSEAIKRLETDPALADLPPCQSMEEADNGTCLITPDLKARALAARAAAGVRPGEAIAPALTAPAPATPTVVGAAPAPAAPTPAQAASPAPTAAPAVPAPTAAPAVPAPPAPVVAVAPPPPASPFSAVARRVRAAALPQIERKIAVVVGVNRYADTTIPQLENAVNDARAVSQVLETSLGYETVVLENATKAQVVRTLTRLAVEAGPKDSIVVYYAGHGELVQATNLGYWQLADSDAKRPETWLSNADITRIVGQMGASQVALISDSCYSGSLVDERIRASGSNVNPNDLLNRKAVVVMSSGGNEPVFDEGKKGHSPFAFSLMNNLQQVATWQPGGNLFERVRFAVARELPQRPRYGSASAAGHQPGTDYLFEQRQLDQKP